MIRYLKEVWAEMKHVSWPSRRQTLIFTIVVVIISVGTSLYLGLSDFLLETGIEQVINR